MSDDDTDGLRPEYPAELIGSGVHGKYGTRFREDSNIVLIDPDLARVFPNAKAVNDALRQFLAEHPVRA